MKKLLFPFLFLSVLPVTAQSTFDQDLVKENIEVYNATNKELLKEQRKQTLKVAQLEAYVYGIKKAREKQRKALQNSDAFQAGQQFYEDFMTLALELAQNYNKTTAVVMTSSESLSGKSKSITILNNLFDEIKDAMNEYLDVICNGSSDMPKELYEAGYERDEQKGDGENIISPDNRLEEYARIIDRMRKVNQTMLTFYASTSLYKYMLYGK